MITINLTNRRRSISICNIRCLEGVDLSAMPVRALMGARFRSVSPNISPRMSCVQVAGRESRNECTRSPNPAGWRTVTPRIAVENPRGLVDFLADVLGPSGRYESSRPSVLTIGDSRIMVGNIEARGTQLGFLYVYLDDPERRTAPWSEKRSQLKSPAIRLMVIAAALSRIHGATPGRSLCTRALMPPNSALLTDTGTSPLRARRGAAKRER